MILSRGAIGATIAATVVAGALSACGGSGGERDGSTVIATTSIWADITSAVMCGETVPTLIPPGADPHSFEISLRDRGLIDTAAVIIANGSGLEGALVDALPDEAVVVEISDGVGVVDGDPHVWQDPRRVGDAIDLIAEAVSRAGHDVCTDGYRAELITLDQEIDEILSPLPPENRVMVTSHDSLGYFASRYDLDVVGTVIPSTNTLAQTNAADLAALADLIEVRDVQAIFTERLESTADADALAARLGVHVVPLVTDALTDDPATDTYLEMMRSNATLIAEALAP